MEEVFPEGLSRHDERQELADRNSGDTGAEYCSAAHDAVSRRRSPFPGTRGHFASPRSGPGMPAAAAGVRVGRRVERRRSLAAVLDELLLGPVTR